MTDARFDFPHAPGGWSASVAQNIDRDKGLTLVDDHWALFRVFQEYYGKA